jgi:hypothetical protein
MAANFTLGVNMRVSPWLMGCILCCSATASAGDWFATASAGDWFATASAGDWFAVEQATTQLSKSQQPAVIYDPGRSVEEFNQRRSSQDPSAFLLVAVEVPRDQLTLRKLANRPVRFETASSAFEGRVGAVFLRSSDSDKLVIHALVENQRNDAGHWLLQPGATGVLSILRH